MYVSLQCIRVFVCAQYLGGGVDPLVCATVHSNVSITFLKKIVVANLETDPSLKCEVNSELLL